MREVVNTIIRRSTPGTDTGELDGWYTDLYDHASGPRVDGVPRDMVTTVFETTCRYRTRGSTPS